MSYTYIYIYVDDGYYYYSLFHLLIVSKSATKLDRQRRIDGKAFSLSPVSLVQSLPIVCERTPLWSHNSSRLVFFRFIQFHLAKDEKEEEANPAAMIRVLMIVCHIFFLGPFSLSLFFLAIYPAAAVVLLSLSCLQ